MDSPTILLVMLSIKLKMLLKNNVKTFYLHETLQFKEGFTSVKSNGVRMLNFTCFEKILSPSSEDRCKRALSYWLR